MNFIEFKQWLENSNYDYRSNDDVLIFPGDQSCMVSCYSFTRDDTPVPYDRIAISYISEGTVLFYNDDQIVFALELSVFYSETGELDRANATIARLQSELDRANRIIDKLCEGKARECLE